MSLEYIRKTYNVPAFRGRLIKFQGERGIIVGARNAHIRVKFDSVAICSLHPTWEVVYDSIAIPKNLSEI